MNRVVLIAALVSSVSLYAAPGLSQYLKGSAREDFIKGTSDGCMRAKVQDEDSKIVPNSLFVGYCRCYANALADKIPISELPTKPLNDPVIKEASAVCYQEMKFEALRLYKAGQYPKQ